MLTSVYLVSCELPVSSGSSQLLIRDTLSLKNNKEVQLLQEQIDI